MGTRADFYLGTGVDAKWLGSVGWDGYEWEEDPECALMTAKTEEEFLAEIARIKKHRNDWTDPERGWPWPWKDSFTTDRTYAFEDGQTKAFRWGKRWDSINEDDDYEGEKVCGWPDMKSVQNVAFDGRSGAIFLQVPKQDAEQ